MKIKSIKYNPRIQAVSHLGKITGEKYIVQEFSVVKSFEYTCKGVSRILEVTPNIYDVYYREYGKEIKKTRIFNPIEVIYET